MRIYLKKHRQLEIVAQKKPERDILKFFKKREPYLVGYGIERTNDEESKVSLTIGFRNVVSPLGVPRLKEREE